MPQGALTLKDARLMFLHVARTIEQQSDELGRADRAVGDGDHGVGMARGFEAARRELENRAFATTAELLRTVGSALLTSMGGASGVVFGTFFRGGAKRLDDWTAFDSEALRRLLIDGLHAVRDRGKAQPGDKTMLDALAPAAEKARELSTASLDELLPSVTEAARHGVEDTRGMIARIGKAKALGERSLGHPDPGALSVYLILRAMAEYVSATGESQS